MKTANVRERESADLQSSSTQDGGATSSFVAMVGCVLSLVVMLCA
jgi:hypothetical protein